MQATIKHIIIYRSDLVKHDIHKINIHVCLQHIKRTVTDIYFTFHAFQYAKTLQIYLKQ